MNTFYYYSINTAGDTYVCAECDYTCSVTECGSTEQGYATGNQTCSLTDAKLVHSFTLKVI